MTTHRPPSAATPPVRPLDELAGEVELALGGLLRSQLELRDSPEAEVLRLAWRRLEDALGAYERAAQQSFCDACGTFVALGDDGHRCPPAPEDA